MASKYIFKLWDRSNEPAKCWDCGRNTLFFITNKKTGEECWCCVECAYKIYKIKRLKALLRKYPLRVKIPTNSLIKNVENRIIEDNSISVQSIKQKEDSK